MMFNKPVSVKVFEKVELPSFLEKASETRFNETYEIDCDKPLTDKQKREMYLSRWRELLWFEKGCTYQWNTDLNKLVNLPNFDYSVFEKITGLSYQKLHGEREKLHGF